MTRTVLVGVRPGDQPRVAERLAARFRRVVTWYDLVDASRMSEARRRPRMASWSGRRVERRRAHAPSASVWPATPSCRADSPAPRSPTLGTRLDRVMARQVEEFGGAERMAAIGDTLTARCPLVYDDAFVALAAHAACSRSAASCSATTSS